MFPSRLVRKINNKIIFPFILIIGIFLVGCDSSETISIQKVDENEVVTDSDALTLQINNKKNTSKDKSKENIIYFGFDLRSSPEEDAAQYLPFLDYLSRSTGYEFKIHFTPEHSSSAQELGNNNVQLSAMGAVSYLTSQEQFNASILARGVNDLNRGEYQSYFIVGPDSKMRDVKHIKGKKLAFGSKNSTQGHLIPRIVMKKNGISLEDLSFYDYTGSHQNCAEAVVSGKFDVCALQDRMANTLVQKGLVKVLHISEYYPSSGIVANNHLSKDQVNKIKKALLNFKPKGDHKNLLYHWDKTEMANGFEDANPSDYEQLQTWLEKLELLN